jgi:ribose transport system permease protein
MKAETSPPSAVRKQAPAESLGIGERLRRSLPLLFLNWGMVFVLLALIGVARATYSGFFVKQNLLNILSQNANTGIVAVGMTFVIIAGGFDLSVGAIYAVGATLFASVSTHHSVVLGAFVGLAAGLAAGVVNGLLVTRFRVNPFVATLGSASAFSGAILIYSHSSPYVVDRSSFTWLGSGKAGTIPVSIFVALAIFLLGGILLSRSIYGRHIYAIGGNDQAARLSGLRVDLIRASSYMMSGLLAALGGMMNASRLGVGQGNVGSTTALDAIAVVVIGGTSLTGGEGAMWRTGVGLLTLAVLTNIFFSLSIDPNWQLVIKGGIIVGAVAIDVALRRRLGR